jgi:DDE superfamily endonuclease
VPSRCGRYDFIISGLRIQCGNLLGVSAKLGPTLSAARRDSHDNASYHKKPLVQSWVAANQDWLEVQPLPKYSPELNATERLWQYSRKNGTHNRYFEREGLLVGTLKRVFGEMQTYPELIRPLLLPFWGIRTS